GEVGAVGGNECEGAIQWAIRHGHQTQGCASHRRFGADEDEITFSRLTSGRTAGEDQDEDDREAASWRGHDDTQGLQDRAAPFIARLIRAGTPTPQARPTCRRARRSGATATCAASAGRDSTRTAPSRPWSAR